MKILKQNGQSTIYSEVEKFPLPNLKTLMSGSKVGVFVGFPRRWEKKSPNIRAG